MRLGAMLMLMATIHVPGHTFCLVTCTQATPSVWECAPRLATELSI